MTPQGASAFEATVRIRRAEPSDADAVGRLFAHEARLHRDLTHTFDLDEPFDWGEMAAGLITGRSSRIVVADAGDEVVGFAYGRLLGGGSDHHRPEPGGLRSLWWRLRGVAVNPPPASPIRPLRRGVVEDCWIEPGHRRQGLARRLFDELAGWMASQGISRVELSVVAANEGAVALWRDLGFEPFRLVLQKSLG